MNRKLPGTLRRRVSLMSLLAVILIRSAPAAIAIYARRACHGGKVKSSPPNDCVDLCDVTSRLTHLDTCGDLGTTINPSRSSVRADGKYSRVMNDRYWIDAKAFVVFVENKIVNEIMQFCSVERVLKKISRTLLYKRLICTTFTNNR